MMVKSYFGSLFHKDKMAPGQVKLIWVAAFFWMISSFSLMFVVNGEANGGEAVANRPVLSALSGAASLGQTVMPSLYVVNFTADWCPNCKVLDPALEEALMILNDANIEHVAFDLTNRQRTNETFNKVNGTILAGVYGDYVGVTGLVVMVAADSGEVIGCATRLVTAEAIALMIDDAKQKVHSQLAGTREVENLLCPPANRKIPV